MESFIYLFLGLIGVQAFGQSEDYVTSIQQYQDTLNAEYANPDISPLTPEDLAAFNGLSFFPIRDKYRVLAKVLPAGKTKPFKMRTTDSRVAIYSKYADLIFSIDGDEYSLEVYQNQQLMSREGYEDYLFLPFLDQTNGSSSYGGGRYISLRIPEGDSIEIDFNKAYNPYCAYSDRYSCPVVPRKNRLKTKIEAGVKFIE